jgi:DNA-binding Lrp family transcriptional regulator
MPAKDTHKTDTLESFGIDDDDTKIMALLQDNPEMSFVEIASKIHKSQPAVGARVTKLRRKNLLVTQNGANFKDLKEKLYLVMVDLQTRDPEPLLTNEEMQQCPFVINIFKRSGPRNVCVLLAASNLQKVESIIDKHYRSNPDVLSVDSSVVVDLQKDLVLPINWDYMKYEDIACGDVCCKKVRGFPVDNQKEESEPLPEE